MNATQTGLESAFAGSQEFVLRICNGKPIAANTAPPIINKGASTPPEVPDPSATAQTKAFNAAILTRSGFTTRLLPFLARETHGAGFI